MQNLSNSGTCGKLCSRLVAPIVACLTLVATVALRVASIVEAILGIAVFLVLGLVLCSPRLLIGAPYSIGHTIRNSFDSSCKIIQDVFKLVLGVGVRGIFCPDVAYENMLKHDPRGCC